MTEQHDTHYLKKDGYQLTEYTLVIFTDGKQYGDSKLYKRYKNALKAFYKARDRQDVKNCVLRENVVYKRDTDTEISVDTWVHRYKRGL